ncbi:MAG TPA: hypothetical protein VMP11_04950 [Verrucomicrobiae bacterium]|nr:hypothetical protein [Verrucomicrobiae bacterium]
MNRALCPFMSPPAVLISTLAITPRPGISRPTSFLGQTGNLSPPIRQRDGRGTADERSPRESLSTNLQRRANPSSITRDESEDAFH